MPRALGVLLSPEDGLGEATRNQLRAHRHGSPKLFKKQKYVDAITAL